MNLLLSPRKKRDFAAPLGVSIYNSMNNWCRLSILTDEVSQELPDVLRFAREFQLDGIEVRSLFGRAFKDLTPADLKTIADQTKDAGLAISGCASPVFKCNL